MKKTVFDFCDPSELKNLFDLCISEDGARQDVTTLATIEKGRNGMGAIMAKEDLVLSGIEAATIFFKWFNPEMTIEILAKDGQTLHAGDVAAQVTGSVHLLLAVERSALNLLQHLSGIATLTRRFVDEIKGTKATVLDTRKTIPGLRKLAKYAVYCGGGRNHRLGLNDAILIKDNHVTAAGSVGQAVIAARLNSPSDMMIEVEVSNLRELEEAMDAGAHRALLDNMSLDEMTECVNQAKGRIVLEASGNVTLKTIREIALTGVDFISSGALTHSSGAADLNMKIRLL